MIITEPPKVLYKYRRIAFTIDVFFHYYDWRFSFVISKKMISIYILCVMVTIEYPIIKVVE